MPSTLVLAEHVPLRAQEGTILPVRCSAVPCRPPQTPAIQDRPTATREPEAPSLLTCFVCHQVPCRNAQRPEDVFWHEAHPLHDGGREGGVALLKVPQQLFGPGTTLGTILGQELVNYQLTCSLVGVLKRCDGGVMPQTHCRTQGVQRFWPMQGCGGID